MILSQQVVPTGGVAEKIILAAVSAALGFASAYALDRIKARREPLRRISWDVDIERASIGVRPNIRSKVRVLYNNEEAEALTHLRCTIANTGNRVVKGHEVRFTLPERASLLEAYLDPQPDPELGVEPISADNSDDGRAQRRYRIAHLERNESVTFNFVTTGGDFRGWQPRSFNEEGDVDFERRDIAVAKQDEEHIRPFLFISFLALLVPGIIGSLQVELFTGFALLGLRMGFFMLLMPHVRPVVRVVQRLIAKQLEARDEMKTDVRAWDGGSVVMLGRSASVDKVEIRPREGGVADRKADESEPAMD